MSTTTSSPGPAMGRMGARSRGQRIASRRVASVSSPTWTGTRGRLRISSDSKHVLCSHTEFVAQKTGYTRVVLEIGQPYVHRLEVGDADIDALGHASNI